MDRLPAATAEDRDARMILSHRHRFIFIKTAKTAGTSIEIALSRLCGPDDVITPMAAADEALRAPVGPRNYIRAAGPFGWKKIVERHPRLFGKPRVGLDPAHDFYNHMPARLVRRYVGEEVWRGYYKFAFERNPWDKHVSAYGWRRRDDPNRLSFRDFVVGREKPRGWELYTEDDRVVVDFVGRFETLAADLALALRKAGVDAPLVLPHAKSNAARGGDWRAAYDDETRALVAGLYAREIAAFGYSFE